MWSIWSIYEVDGVVLVMPEFHAPERGEKLEEFKGYDSEVKEYVRKKFPDRIRFIFYPLLFGVEDWEGF